MRASVFAVACVLVSAALHVMAGGTISHPGMIVTALAPAWTGAYVLGGRQRGVPALLAACFAAQYGMHHLFGATLPDLPFMTGQAAHEHGGGLGMLLVHTVAAFGSAWWLAKGDAALATLLRLAVASVGMLWTALLILVCGPVDAVRPGGAACWDDPAPRRPSPFAATVLRRGPPIVFSVL
ncbi:hypothetical protein [Nonomuraea rubra]|uniref:MFS transporter n=1 Tax=Nonomuraea rubra TaxID=46180 RepID=A0A7X0P1E3_9ACTN|nr:hypothetical protein [Nonomuraea rubra]MBB6553236.1 hypothetical protein [Nonomuraea rubra]